MVSIAGARSLLGSLRRRHAAETAAIEWPDPVRNLSASEFEVDLWILSRFVLE